MPEYASRSSGTTSKTAYGNGRNSGQQAELFAKPTERFGTLGKQLECGITASQHQSRVNRRNFLRVKDRPKRHSVGRNLSPLGFVLFLTKASQANGIKCSCKRLQHSLAVPWLVQLSKAIGATFGPDSGGGITGSNVRAQSAQRPVRFRSRRSGHVSRLGRRSSVQPDA